MNNPEQKDPLLLDHDYDGIQELDNPLPRWWVYLFVLSCIFAVCYFSYYTFFGGPTLSEELDIQLAKKNSVVSSSNKVDFAAIINDAGIQAKGKVIFDTKCASCHNTQGQGLIGPNLTDAYWIHGEGTPEDIQKVVVEGVTDKGMLAWKTLLKPEEIQQVVVFVHHLRGTNPPNPKEPQGTKID